MPNFKGSDYAVNKFTKGIVYPSVTGAIEITSEDVIKDDPSITDDDFAGLKAFSDKDYYDRYKADRRQTRRTVSMYYIGNTQALAEMSSDSGSFNVASEYEAAEERERRLVLANQALATLTEKQRKHFILNRVEGIPSRKIAEQENITHKTVLKSVWAAEKKIKKFLDSV